MRSMLGTTGLGTTGRGRGPISWTRVLRFVLANWRGQRWLVGGVALAMLAATLADVAVPIYAGRLVDAVSAAGAPQRAAWDAGVAAIMAMLALGVANAALRHLANLGTVRLTLRAMSEILTTTFGRLLRLSAEWHANSFAGSVVRRVTRGVWALDLLTDTLLLALMPAVVVLAGMAVLLGWHWPAMGIAIAGGGALYLAMAVLLSLNYVAPSARLANLWDTRLGGALADAVTCNAVVRAFGAETREEVRLGAAITKWRGRTRRSWMRATNNGTAQVSALVGLRLIVVGLALLLWWHGHATGGDVATVLTAYFVIHGYLAHIGFHVRNLQRSVNDMEEMVALAAEPMAIADRPDAVAARIASGAITFDRVGFHYPGHATPLFDGLSLTIGAGERVGLVGVSGSGKTTFTRLIQRLYDVTGGRVLIDGTDVRAVRQASLRAAIAVVPQEPILFHRTLAENIAYARPHASAAEIVQAARLANAHEFIALLPGGYGTLVGERGIKLSGGERQRVAIARAILAEAPILMLDEATSSLDSVSEHLIQQALARLMQGRTAIVIAHRLSTVRAMDRILVFERGRIVEQGTHDGLLARDGMYRRLFEHQAMARVDTFDAAGV